MPVSLAVCVQRGVCVIQVRLGLAAVAVAVVAVVVVALH